MARKTLKILLLGGKSSVLDDAKAYLADDKLTIYTGLNIDDVKQVMVETAIDHVFMGAGIELDKRLEIARYVIESSDSTNVHLKDKTGGASGQGFAPYVKAVLVGLKERLDG